MRRGTAGSVAAGQGGLGWARCGELRTGKLRCDGSRRFEARCGTVGAVRCGRSVVKAVKAGSAGRRVRSVKAVKAFWYGGSRRLGGRVWYGGEVGHGVAAVRSGGSWRSINLILTKGKYYNGKF